MSYFNVNNIKVYMSNQGSAGYLGVTVSTQWTMNNDKPFIAMTGNPIKIPNLERWLTAKKRNSLHLGKYADSREAAYVTALYKSNPELYLEELYENKCLNVFFPKKLYDLPIFLRREEAPAYVKREKEIIKMGRARAVEQKLSLEIALQLTRQEMAGKNMLNVPDVKKMVIAAMKNAQFVNDQEKNDIMGFYEE